MGQKPLHPEFVPSIPVYSPLTLIAYRKKIYLTQIQMALHLRVPVSTYRAWEYGTNFMAEPVWAYFLIQYRRIRKKLEKKNPQLVRLSERI